MKQGIFLCLCWWPFAGGLLQTPSALPVVKHKPVMISHRGNHEQVPENTLASIREAITAHADYVEVDLRTTRDGYLVLSHDATLQRMTGKNIQVSECSWDSIRTLTLAGSSPQDRDGMHVPLFEDVLKRCRGKINIYLDFKDASVEETFRQITHAGMAHQIVVYLNRPSQYGEWKRVAPTMPLMSSLPDSIADASGFDRFFAQVPLEVFDNIHDPAILAAAHQKGVQVWLDVQAANEGPESWTAALRSGVDGLQTDHPTALGKFLQH